MKCWSSTIGVRPGCRSAGRRGESGRARRIVSARCVRVRAAVRGRRKRGGCRRRVERECLARDLAAPEQLVKPGQERLKRSSPVMGTSLDRAAAAVGGDGGAGYVARSWGGEERDDLGDLLGL